MTLLSGIGGRFAERMVWPEQHAAHSVRNKVTFTALLSDFIYGSFGDGTVTN